MGRKYHRKTSRERDENAIKLALVDIIEKGVSIRKTSLEHRVPRSTLMDYVKRKKEGKYDNEDFKLASYSVRQVLSSEMEHQLANYMLMCSDMFYGLPTKVVKRLAYEYAVANNCDVPPSWRRNKAAGRDWFTGFLERTNLSLRYPEATSIAHMQTKMQEVLSRYAFQDIYKLDETGCTTVQGPHQVMSRERGELVTMVGIVCANGNALPPSFIFPSVRFDEARMMNGVPNSCQGLVYPSGWMTSENFLAVLEHFTLHTRCSKDHKVLLIMDNHDSHLSVDGIDFAKENGIVILTLPPHTSNKLQPLVSVYDPFKTFYCQGLNEWMLQNPGRAATIYDIAPIMYKAWDRSATPVDIKSGFRNTGIFPFSTMVFGDEDFACSYVTDRPDPPAGTQADMETVPLQEASISARKETSRGRRKGKCTIV